jgi:hypothetical protein
MNRSVVNQGLTARLRIACLRGAAARAAAFRNGATRAVAERMKEGLNRCCAGSAPPSLSVNLQH